MERMNSEMELSKFRDEEDKTPGLAELNEKCEKAKFLAQLSLRFEKYEDAIIYVDEIIKHEENELSEEDRDLFVSAYRIFINEKRNAWRTVFINENAEKEQKTKFSPMLNEIRGTYEDIIQKACEKLIYCINEYIINKTHSVEGKSFFLKVKADHYRYLAEISTGQNLRKYIENALQFYNDAYIASAELSPLNNIRLGIALNDSVFHYEVLNSSYKALEIATQSLNDALEELNGKSYEALEDNKMKESFVTIQMIKDNIHTWYEEMENELTKK
jgi:14-3-3 protein epsilon